MVDEETMIAEKLRHWAACYNCKSFIPDDPVQFPHRYEKRQDIEISAFLTAWIAYGNRKMILRKAEELHQYMGESPYKFICKKDFSFAGFPNRKTPTNRRDTFYRFYTFSHLREICERLHGIYKNSGDMETAMMATQKILYEGKTLLLYTSMPIPETRHDSSRYSWQVHGMAANHGLFVRQPPHLY